jgi:hypothetical protein
MEGAMMRCLLLLLLAVMGCKSQPSIVHADSESPHWMVRDFGMDVLKDSDPSKTGYLQVEGFWVPTSASKEKQLPFPLAIKIRCVRSEGVCREIGAQVTYDLLSPAMEEYTISSWSRTGIVADEETRCNMAHRLTISFTGKTVSVVDYPTAPNKSELCEKEQDATSYVLHDGAIMLNHSLPFDQSGVKR